MSKRENSILIVLVILLYTLNQNIKSSIDIAIIRQFLIGYFNDILCGLGFIAYCNFLSNKKQITQLHKIIILLTITGLFWEYITPLYRKHSVTDTLDILAYNIGGMGYWILFKIKTLNKKGEYYMSMIGVFKTEIFILLLFICGILVLIFAYYKAEKTTGEFDKWSKLVDRAVIFTIITGLMSCVAVALLLDSDYRSNKIAQKHREMLANKVRSGDTDGLTEEEIEEGLLQIEVEEEKGTSSYEKNVKNGMEKLSNGRYDDMTEDEKKAAEDFMEWQSKENQKNR